MRKKLLFCILVLSAITIISSTNNVFLWIRDHNNNKKLMEQLKNTAMIKEPEPVIMNDILINPPEDENDNYWKYKELDFLQIDFTNLLEQNKDTVGWIKVEGTLVDYPVVQTNDNNYYLNHSFDNTENEAGWIFSDFRNNFSNLNSNSIIYGHARKDKTMFGSLKDILENDWYQNEMNHIIKFSTPEENMIFQIFSIYTIPKETYYLTSNFSNLDSFDLFIDTIVKRSYFKFNTTVDTKDKILTLSTCKDNYGNRLVIHAKLIRKGTN